MATIFVLFGIIGHIIGIASTPTRDVCSILYPTPDRRNAQPGRLARVAAKFSRRSEGKG
jgi:hypothetical protein